MVLFRSILKSMEVVSALSSLLPVQVVVNETAVNVTGAELCPNACSGHGNVSACSVLLPELLLVADRGEEDVFRIDFDVPRAFSIVRAVRIFHDSAGCADSHVSDRVQVVEGFLHRIDDETRGRRRIGC